MFYSISLYISIAIFICGLIYKIATWLSRKIGVDSKDIPTSKKALISTERNNCNHI